MLAQLMVMEQYWWLVDEYLNGTINNSPFVSSEEWVWVATAPATPAVDGVNKCVISAANWLIYPGQ